MPARLSRRSVLRTALAIGAVGALFFGVLPRLADLSSVWSHMSDVTGGAMALLVLVALASLVIYGFVLMSVMPGLSLSQAFVVSQSSTAVANTMPAGGALALGVSFRFFGSWGYDNQAITRNVLLTGIWNVLCKLAFPVVALGLVVLGGGASSGLVAASLIGLGVLVGAIGLGALVLHSERFAQSIGHWGGAVVQRVMGWVRRPITNDGGATAVRFRSDTIGLLRQRGGRLTVTMVLFHGSVFLVLLMSLRAVGVSAGNVSWVEALAAFAIARLASTVPITPGGLGFVELGLAGALIAAGGVQAEVVAGVLIFRMLSFFLPLPIGLVTYFVWRHHRSWRRDTPSPDPDAEPVLEPEVVPEPVTT